MGSRITLNSTLKVTNEILNKIGDLDGERGIALTITVTFLGIRPYLIALSTSRSRVAY